MKKIFEISSPFPVPDGTLLSPFLNSKDANSELPFDLLEGLSLAAGEIKPSQKSKIHVMPFVTQIIFVMRGNLTVITKAENDEEQQEVDLGPNQATIIKPNTFLQLNNPNEEDTCRVLYIVSPPYVYDVIDNDGEKEVVYDDSFVYDEEWNELAKTNWPLPPKMVEEKNRIDALGRLRNKKAE